MTQVEVRGRVHQTEVSPGTVSESLPALGTSAFYNTAHHHSGLGLLTPHDVHHGLAEHRVAARAAVLAAAYGAHPERFAAGLPQPPARPEAVWINPPKIGATQEALLH